MPDHVRNELEAAGVVDEYRARPFYQRNDYLSWIGRAKKPETQRKRLLQMLDELKQGGIYMGMDHSASAKD